MLNKIYDHGKNLNDSNQFRFMKEEDKFEYQLNYNPDYIDIFR